MFQYIYEWVENIAFYMILATAVIQVIPDNNYKKYLKFFTGLILVVLLAGPVLKVFGMDGTFESLYMGAQYDTEIEKIEEKTTYLNETALPESLTRQEGAAETGANTVEVEEIEIGE